MPALTWESIVRRARVSAVVGACVVALGVVTAPNAWAVTWTPTNTSVLTTDSPLTPNALAVASSSSNTIEYSVTNQGGSDCSVNSTTAVLTFSTAGACEVTATELDGSLNPKGTSIQTFTISLAPQTVTWAPTNTSVLTTDSPLTPNALAVASSSSNTIEYSVTNQGGSDCSVNSTTAVLTFSTAGACEVTATELDGSLNPTGQTALQTFTISAPGGGGGGGGGGTPTPTPTPQPTSSATPDPGASPSPTATPSAPRPNGPANPPNGSTREAIGPGVTLVSRAVAQVATPRLFNSKATTELSTAPVSVRVVKGQEIPIYRVRQLVRLVARVPASAPFDLRIKIGGRYYDMGSARSDGNGQLSLPVFGATRAVTYPVAMIDRSGGKTYYVKIKIGPAL